MRWSDSSGAIGSLLADNRIGTQEEKHRHGATSAQVTSKEVLRMISKELFKHFKGVCPVGLARYVLWMYGMYPGKYPGVTNITRSRTRGYTPE